MLVQLSYENEMNRQKTKINEMHKREKEYREAMEAAKKELSKDKDSKNFKNKRSNTLGGLKKKKSISKPKENTLHRQNT